MSDAAPGPVEIQGAHMRYVSAGENSDEYEAEIEECVLVPFDIPGIFAVTFQRCADCGALYAQPK